jgi:hypothetical protein
MPIANANCTKARRWIAFQKCVKDVVGNAIGEFIGMAF